MKLVSLNVGLPREIEWQGKTTRTSIFKQAVTGRRRLTRLNVEGDAQANLVVHGGPEKAIYAYPAEHYLFWRGELPRTDLPWGAFGENMTTEGILETEVFIGDRWRIGSAEFTVTQPRMPCFKLGIRFERPDMVKRFLDSRRTGFYLSVRVEGEVGAGDSITITEKSSDGVTVADVVNLYAADFPNQDLLLRAIRSSALPESWRESFRERLVERNK
jgi:MOSC domain-containing protein YiiM